MAFLLTDAKQYRELPCPGTDTIGSGTGNSIRPESQSVSKSHAILTINRIANTSKVEVFLEDFNSRNGTFVGETPLDCENLAGRRRLQYGDHIRFGHSQKHFRLLDQLPPNEDVVIKVISAETFERSRNLEPSASYESLVCNDHTMDETNRLGSARGPLHANVGSLLLVNNNIMASSSQRYQGNNSGLQVIEEGDDHNNNNDDFNVVLTNNSKENTRNQPLSLTIGGSGEHNNVKSGEISPLRINESGDERQNPLAASVPPISYSQHQPLLSFAPEIDSSQRDAKELDDLLEYSHPCKDGEYGDQVYIQTPQHAREITSNFFPLEIQELRRPEMVYTLHVHCFKTVHDVKTQLQNLVGFPAERLRLFPAPTLAPLRDRATLMEIGVEEEGHMLLLSYEFGSTGDNLVEPARGMILDQSSKEMLQSVQQGLKGTQTSPKKTDLLDCTGGVYFMKSGNGEMVAVFKPQDEEQGMSNNPKGYAGNGIHGLRPNFRPGEGYIREFAAYVLDFENFCGVPTTTIAYCEHPVFNYPIRYNQNNPTKVPKLGSLQAFIRANDTFDDISPSVVSTFELQKIALLDMRLLNCDRNASNMLAIRKPQSVLMGERRSSRSGSTNSWTDDSDREIDIHDFIEDTRPAYHVSSDSYELIPIDHGYCLPTHLLIEEMDWAWFYSAQVARPVDPRIIEYMNKLNLEDLIATLTSQVSIPEESIHLLRVVHELIVQGINSGLTLKDIASMIARVEEGVPSPLEKLLNLAEDNAYLTIENRDAHYPPQQLQKTTGSSFEGAFSPNRRKSPNTVFVSSTPPRGEQVMRRVVKSELFQEQSEQLYRPKPISLQQQTSSTDLQHGENDYFISDLGSPSTMPVKPIVVRRSPILPPSFAPLAGVEMKRMQTVDSAGVTLQFQSLFGNHPPSEFSVTAPMTFAKPETTVPSLLPATSVDRQNTVGTSMDTDSGYTASEASSYESAPSPNRRRYPPGASKFFGASSIDQSSVAFEKHDNKPYASRVKKSNSLIDDVGGGDLSPFEAMEVLTVQPLVFERQRSHDGYESGTDNKRERGSTYDGTSMSSTPSETMFEQMSQMHVQEILTMPTPMVRVASWGALESPALYNIDFEEEGKAPRQLHRMRREKRKLTQKSPEFLDLRRHFARFALKKLVSKVAKGSSMTVGRK
jgi:pSer/pThr/pTyr-binding forkhead associated (FHA) protein